MQELQYAKKWVEIVKYRIFIGNFYQYLLFRQHSDGMKKLDQAVKDVEYYRQVKPSDLFSLWKLFDTQEAENLRTRYNDVILEKQRLDSEVISLRRFENIFLVTLTPPVMFRFLDEDRQEMYELRRQQQEMLNSEGGPSESLSIMYGTLLRKYETVKEDFAMLSTR